MPPFFYCLKMNQTFIDWLNTQSQRCVLVEVGANVGGVEKTLYLSNRQWASSSTDSPASTQYLDYITGGVRVDRSISMEGDVSSSYGDIELDNSSGQLDEWFNYVFEGRDVSIYFGDPAWDKAQFAQVFTGVAVSIDSRKRDRLNLKIGDRLQSLNASISAPVITVSSGDEKQCPLVFGEVFNITPLLLDSAQLVYKVHDGQVERIIEVRDNGVPVQFTPLKTAGAFQLLAQPIGTITVSVQGDAVGGYSNTVGGVIEKIIARFAPENSNVSPASFNSTKLAQFKAAYTQPIGVFITDKTNLLALCNSLAKSVGHSLAVGADGLFYFTNFIPSPSTPSIGGIGVDDIVYQGITPTKIKSPSPKVKVGYAKNWTVQASGLSAGIPASHLSLFADEWLTVSKTDLEAVTLYKYTVEPALVETFLLKATDAGMLALNLLQRDGKKRTTYGVNGFASFLQWELGDCLTLTHPRWGLASGVKCTVTSVGFDLLKGSYSLEVFV
jgi:hypothetical protein